MNFDLFQSIQELRTSVRYSRAFYSRRKRDAEFIFPLSAVEGRLLMVCISFL